MNVTKSKLRIFDDISNYTSSQIFEEYFDKLFKVLRLSNTLKRAKLFKHQRMVRLLVEIVNMPVFETVYDLLAADRENLADKLQEMVQLLRLHTDRQVVRFD